MRFHLTASQFVFSARRWIFALVLLICVPRIASGSVTGRVINRSRNRPSAGDDVVLYKVDGSMHEVARTRSRDDGTFRFDYADFPHLVAVFHQGVSYHTGTLRRTEPIEIAVFDSTPQLGGVQPDSSTLFVERASGEPAVKITEFFSLSNQTQPPRTVTGGATFRFALPAGAIIESAAVQPPGTLPVRIETPVCGRATSYCVGYPIRPGVTRLRVVFHVSQSEAAWITVPQPAGVKNLAVMVPELLRLESRNPGALIAKGIEGGQAKYVVRETRTARPLVFRLEGAEEVRFRLASPVSGDEARVPSRAVEAMSLDRYIAVASTWPAQRNMPQPAGTGGRSLLLGAIVALASIGTFGAAGVLSRGARRRGAA